MGKQSSIRQGLLRRGLATCIAASLVALLVTACDRGRGADDPSSQQGAQPGQQPGAMPGAMPTGPNATPGYGTPGQPGAQPGAPAQAASPLALPCQNDLICGTHKCNMQTGRCSFPCATNTDCQGGFSCNTALGPAALCVPGGATQ
jgi:hypothetical protein